MIDTLTPTQIRTIELIVIFTILSLPMWFGFTFNGEPKFPYLVAMWLEELREKIDKFKKQKLNL